MYSADDFVKVIKKTAMDAVNASKPTNMVFGKVISANPLKIQIEQKLTLGSAQLVLSRNVTNYTVSMTVNHTTGSASGGAGESAFASHSHTYSGTKAFTVHNALTVGDEVILMQMLGGQKYIVVDRIGKG